MSNPAYESWQPAPGRWAAQGDQPRRPDPADDAGNEDSSLVWFARMAKVFVWFIYAVILAVLVILTLGFVLRLLGANPEASFASWVYRHDDRIMEPFRGMFPTETIGERSEVDFSLLFGMVFYAILALLLHALVAWLSRKTARLARGLDVWT